jgi:hypothetical protein
MCPVLRYAVKNKIRCASVLHYVSVRISTRIIRHYSNLNVHHHFNVSPSDGCVSAANEIRRIIDVFNNNSFISLIDIFYSFSDSLINVHPLFCPEILGFILQIRSLLCFL